MRYGGERQFRRYYSTTEISDRTGLDAPQLLRLEKLFAKARPMRSRTGRKLYRDQELEFLLPVAELLKNGVAWGELEERLDAPLSLRELLQPLRDLLLSALRAAKGESH